MKGGRLFRQLLLWVNWLFALALVISNIASWIDPNDFLPLAFLGLGFLPLLALNVLFIVLWLLIRWRYALFGITAILLSTGTLSNHLSLWSPPAERESDFKVVSFNVRLFDLYNWSNNKQTRDQILDHLVSENANILCLQEYFNSDDSSYFKTLDTLVTIQQAKHYHEEFTAIMHNGRHKFGIATLSSFPIVERGQLTLDTAGHNIAIYTDLLIRQDTLRVYNVHLASVHLTAMEKDISEHIERNDQQKQWDDIKEMAGRLSGGFKRRASQSRVIAEHVAQSPHPVVLCGDFNDTPGSYAYATLNDHLVDCFAEKGSGMGSTYIGFFPSLRIDYLMHSPELELNTFETQDIRLSDHRPLVGEFVLNP